MERILVAPPGSRLGPIDPAERSLLMADSLVRGIYDAPLDRDSAYEILQRRAREADGVRQSPKGIPGGRGGSRQTPFEAFAKSALRSVGEQLGRSLVRGILGSLGGRRRH